MQNNPQRNLATRYADGFGKAYMIHIYFKTSSVFNEQHTMLEQKTFTPYFFYF